MGTANAALFGRWTIPPIVSRFVTVIKDSMFAMAIGAYELMFKGMIGT